jgi:Flp pilus assembly pilin Flp
MAAWHSTEYRFDLRLPATRGRRGAVNPRVTRTASLEDAQTRRHGMRDLFARLVREDEGQDLIEYVLLGSVVSIGALTGASLLGTNLDGWYSAVAGWVATQSAAVP